VSTAVFFRSLKRKVVSKKLHLVLLLIVLLSGLLLSGLLLIVLFTTSRLLLIVLFTTSRLLFGGLLVVFLSRLLFGGLLIGISRLLIRVSRLLIGIGRLLIGVLGVRGTEHNNRRLAAGTLLDGAETFGSALGGRPGVLHAKIISNSSGLVTSTLLDGAETFSSTLGGSLNVLHGHGITSHTRLLTSTLLDGTDVLGNTLGSVSGLTDSNSISHSSGLGNRGVLLAVHLTIFTNKVGKGELKTADGALEAGLVVGLLDGVDRLKRISGLSADGTLCSRHDDTEYF